VKGEPLWQELLITDVTRMGGKNVCIAGLDADFASVRLVLPPPGIHEHYLYDGDHVLIRPRAIVRANVQPLI
jgi:hypothetical protein